MDKAQNVYDIWTFVGVILCILVVYLGLYGLNKIMGDDARNNLEKLLVFVLGTMMLIFLCDTVVVVRRHLLSEKQSNDLFQMIKEYTGYLIVYHLGKQSNKNN